MRARARWIHGMVSRQLHVSKQMTKVQRPDERLFVYDRWPGYAMGRRIKMQGQADEQWCLQRKEARWKCRRFAKEGRPAPHQQKLSAADVDDERVMAALGSSLWARQYQALVICWQRPCVVHQRLVRLSSRAETSISVLPATTATTCILAPLPSSRRHNQHPGRRSAQTRPGPTSKSSEIG
jgi:hypothetical protein